jgi:cysteine desulfurase/selenocysteine lyase
MNIHSYNNGGELSKENLDRNNLDTDFDVEKIRNDFPVLSQKVYGKPLVYFDNAATTQKPKVVIDTLNKLYSELNSNVHRGVHYLSEEMTKMYEEAREKVRKFINAKKTSEIIFTKGTTDSINLVAFSFGEAYINEGDEIIISEMEHHSNIVPWQMLCQRKKAKLKVIPFNDKGELLLDEYKKLFSPKTKLVAIVHVSNSLGTINPVKEIVTIAHERGIPVLIDGTQAIQHEKINVQDIDCDFYAFSGHKIYGPTGIGVLYGKECWLKEMPPYQGGGEMIEEVTFEKTTYTELPLKFEAGTPNYIGAIGLGVALDYLTNIGMERIRNYEKKLLEYGTEKLRTIKGLRIYGTAKNKVPIFSFLLDNISAYDTGLILDKMGIAVRTGHHCTQPIWDHYGVDGSVRASLAFYNTIEEIDYFCECLIKIQKMFN